ncbi:MAG TPA: tRNA (adenosine(37)-N6)-threonylcarbamoyltransferase complex transferase subunit TsaD [bacterium]|nr:tRNA (adenosine(37)-N6)-threonylcarbamoyltransferase complex transferase subunit TsaD [bacterium]HPL95581.1 tRNA (adenosine(37)-N6)-threonylcarbamoyltransferase complex transferase subunit TsaD [bacterium]
MKILALETSCDETAAAVLAIKNSRFNLLSNVVSSQVKIHAKFGGIVPEVAARKQMEMVIPVLEQALKQANSNHQETIFHQLKSIDYFAVTQGPGLITSLTVGVETAKTLAFSFNKPLIFVNHLAGHAYSSLLSTNQEQTANDQTIKFPALALVVSGGHTMLVLMKKNYQFEIIGQTLDDAAGEAFDKVAQILNLGYPGGPIVSRLAACGDRKKYNLPRPMLQQDNFNFSFSGLKTAVLYLLPKLKKNNKNISSTIINDLCASFDQAVVDVLVNKTLRALKKYQAQTFLLGGGVAANPLLRATLIKKISQQFSKTKILIPELKFTGDNAAMIALAAYFKVKKSGSRIKFGMTKKIDYKKIKAEPNFKLGRR